MKILIIHASTRTERSSEPIANWVINELEEFKPDTTEEVMWSKVDLRELDLPHFDGIPASAQAPEYANDWANVIKDSDGFLIITPEYNHSFPGALKDALDAVYHEWGRKPVAFISYGGAAGGSRAVEALRLVVAELHMASLRNQVLIPAYSKYFNDEQEFVADETIKSQLEAVLSDLVWWAEALKEARNKEDI